MNQSAGRVIIEMSCNVQITDIYQAQTDKTTCLQGVGLQLGVFVSVSGL